MLVREDWRTVSSWPLAPTRREKAKDSLVLEDAQQDAPELFFIKKNLFLKPYLNMPSSNTSRLMGHGANKVFFSFLFAAVPILFFRTTAELNFELQWCISTTSFQKRLLHLQETKTLVLLP